MSAPDSWRERLYIVIFQTDTRDGRRFDSALLLVILASLLVVMIDSIDEIHQDYGDLLAYIEWGFTGIFLVEYLLRLYCSPSRCAMPSALRPGRPAGDPPRLPRPALPRRPVPADRPGDTHAADLPRAQAAPVPEPGQFLLTALRGSKQKIIVFFLTVMTLVTVFWRADVRGRRPGARFHQHPRGIYWAIVTLTTVGFGDITPKTPLGRPSPAW